VCAYTCQKKFGLTLHEPEVEGLGGEGLPRTSGTFDFFFFFFFFLSLVSCLAHGWGGVGVHGRAREGEAVYIAAAVKDSTGDKFVGQSLTIYFDKYLKLIWLEQLLALGYS
jgi:hypothetical protein